MSVHDEPQFGGLMDKHWLLNMLLFITIILSVYYVLGFIGHHLVCPLPENTDASRIIWVWEGCPFD